MTPDPAHATWSRNDYVMALAQAALTTSEPLFRSDRLKNAGRLDEARGAYAELCDRLGRQLDLTLELNARGDGPPMEVVTIAQPLINALDTWADVSETLADRAGAEELRARAAALTRAHLPPTEAANHARQLAAVRAAQGRYDEAITLLSEAGGVLEHAGQPLAAAAALAQLADTLEWLGDRARARDAAERATALLEPMLAAKAPSQADILAALLQGKLQEAQDRAGALAAWSQLVQLDARLSRDLGDRDRAAALYAQVRPHVPSVAAPAIDFQLARLVIERGRPAEGLAQLAALEPAFTGLLRPKLGVVLGWEAEALLALGRAAEAAPIVERAVAELAQHDDLDSLWRTQWLSARVQRALGRDALALAAIGDAVDTITRARRSTLGYRLDSTYLADKLPVVEAGIDLAIAQGDARTACTLIERVKARALTAILSAPRADRGDGRDPRADELDRISRQLDALEYQAFRSGWTDESHARRDQLLDRRRALIEQIRIAEPRWHGLSEPAPFDLDAAIARLRATRRAAITLYLRERRLTAVLVDGDGCIAGEARLGDDTAAALDAYCRSADPAGGSPLDPAQLAGLALERLVPDPVLARAARATSLLISPHGPLHLLPWAALAWGGARVFEGRATGVIPNLSCLTLLAWDDEGPAPVALIGAPAYPVPGPRALPLARDELAAIDDLYREGAGVLGDVVEGTAATRAAFVALAARDDAEGATLHVVCHGDFVSDEPLYSGLLLGDGKIDAAAIAAMPLRYHEVVLSSCSSGYRGTSVEGVPLTGDDVVGLVGAFLEAGARSVIVSITRAADDATYDFMTTYHGHRVRGEPPLEALRRTQLDLLGSGSYPPARWAAITRYGA